MDYWEQYEKDKQLVAQSFTDDLHEVYLHLLGERINNQNTFDVYSQKRLKTNEQRMFIDNFYDLNYRISLIEAELQKRGATLEF